MSNGYLTGCALVIAILITVMFFIKKSVNNIETKIFKKMLVCNIFEALTTTFIVIVALTINSNMIFKLLNRIDVIWIISWCSLMFYYIYSISSFSKKYQIKRFIYIINTIIFVLALILNVEIINNNGMLNSTGSLTYLGLIGAVFYIVLMILILIKSKSNDKLDRKKCIPLYFLMILLVIVAILRLIIPEINFISISLSLVDMIMIFTIENPDLKMIEELNIARDQADKANNAKTEFLSNMSHEIRTPLNAITGFSQALSEEDLPDSAKEDVKDILMASDSLLEIVNGILDISKIEAGKLEIVNTYYNPYKVFKELAVLTKARLGSDRPIELRVNIDETIPKSLYGDYARLKQIILNILTNAVKYTNEGYIEFKVAHLEKDGICRLIVSVEDSGIGIKRDKIDKLFNKFERLDEERNITIEGTGLGLAITKHLVQLMNGQLVVQSLYGKGSKFTVSIDQRIAEDPNKMEDTASIAVNTKTKSQKVKDKKVLVVDDNKLNIKVATRLLGGYEIIVDSVMSGFECIDKIKAGNTYDLILMDDMMPKMTGTQTLAKLKEQGEFKTPTIALTANAIAGMKEKYLENGFDDYLAKPIERKELDRIINKYLNQD